MADFVGAIDQGTTSTRFMVFDYSGNEVGRHQLEHQQIMLRAGWVEHDPVEIWEGTRTVVERALADICYQSKDVALAMEQDSGVRLEVLKVDGGVTGNDLCMQLQADILGVPVSKPLVAETTALGAAYSAGLAIGFWSDLEALRQNWNEDRRWHPAWNDEQRDRGYAGWKKAVQRTLDWVDFD